MQHKSIKTALISVYHKDGLETIIEGLKVHDITVYTTGGTYDFLNNRGLDLRKVEDLTSYPSILDGRVKTLHPKIYGGLLSTNSTEHQKQIFDLGIPSFDLAVVNLYPFTDMVSSGCD